MRTPQFDEFMKDRFGTYSPAVDPRIWENILAAREGKRPRGIWFYFLNGKNLFLSIGLLAVLGTGAWIFFNNTSKNQIDNHTTGNSTPSNDKINFGISPSTPAENQPVITENNVQTPSLSIADPAAVKPGIYSPLNDLPALAVPAGSNYRGVNGTTFIPVDKEVMANGYSENEENSLLRKLFFPIDNLYTSRQTAELNSRRMKNVVLPGCPQLERDASANKRYYEVYAGPDYAIRSFSDTSNTSPYLQSRQSTTSFNSAFSAGVRYTRVFNSGMSVRAGVNYSQINEKFKLVQGGIIQVVYITNAQGDTIGSYTQTGTRVKTTYNHFRSVDIPLQLGYEIGNGKLHANLGAGVIVNIRSWAEGEVLDVSGNPVSISTGKNSSPYQFKTNTGVGFLGSASVYYKLNDNVHVLAEPYFRYNLSPLSNEKQTLKQKYNTAGLRVGLRVDF